MCPAFGAVQIATLAGRFHQKPRQRRGLGHGLSEGLAAMGADKTVRVMLFGQKQEFDTAHIGGIGQRTVEGFARGPAPGAVAIKTENHRVGKAKQLLHMVGRAGGTQRGDGVGKTELGQRHHVHIPLGDQRIALVAQMRAGFKQSVQFAALAKDRGLGRIEVFGLLIAQHAAAKADALALDIADREHHPVAKAVVAFFFGAFFGVADHQTAFNQQRVVVAGENTGQAAPTLGRVAQAKALGHLAREAAPFEIGHGARRVFELAPVGVAGFFEHAGEGVLLLALFLSACAVLGRGLVLGHLHAKLLGQVIDRFDKAHAGMVHQKTNRIAVFAAAKTVVELLGRADRKRGRFFAMKRAQAHVIGAAFFQLHIAPNDVHDIGAREQLLNKGLGDGHGAGAGGFTFVGAGVRAGKTRRWASCR